MDLGIILKFLGSRNTAAVLKIAASNAALAFGGTLLKKSQLKSDKLLANIADKEARIESEILLSKIKENEAELNRLKEELSGK